MEKKKKIFVLLPDGVGLRNFAFTKFHERGKQNNFDVLFWNNTDFDLTQLGFEEIKTPQKRIHLLTDIIKAAKIQVLLNWYTSEFKDTVYQTYKFNVKFNGVKSYLRFLLTKILEYSFGYKGGYVKLQNWIEDLEEKTENFKDCVIQLKNHKPDMVFCTNQRPVLAIAPLLAAKKMGIPTATFIFSWDNLPKATMVVDTDYYFVWSDFMKEELLKYYPHIKDHQIRVTGTPQFEPHYYEEGTLNRQEFYSKYNLNLDREYICFSGDDVTTSPNDSYYLNDLAEAITKLNSEGENLGIIFRRCPVDFSNRYDAVLKEYKDIIVPIDPIWKQQGDTWDTVMPTKEDLMLLVTIIKNTKLVVNIASSMIFDYATMNKVCLYINYNVDPLVSHRPGWSSDTIYNFVHFRSMPSKDVVLWINDKNEFKDKIKEALIGSDRITQEAASWFKKIVKHPVKDSSDRIWTEIEKII